MSDDEAATADDDLVVGDDGLRRPRWAARDPLLREYYDTEWGVPVRDEAGVYERLTLEAFQCGLSWRTILAKRPAFRAAFAGFDPDAVAAFGEADRDRLLADAGIVRNARKIDAAITNARATVTLRGYGPGGGGLAELVWSSVPEVQPEPRRAADVPSSSPESVELAKALKGHGFVLVGPTTVFALMEALGVVNTHLIGSHRRSRATGRVVDAPGAVASRHAGRLDTIRGSRAGSPASARAPDELRVISRHDE